MATNKDFIVKNGLQVGGDVVRNRLRAEREPLMAKLDTDWFRAAETVNTDAQVAIATQKQALRDITTHASIDRATTVDELSLITLDTLLGN